MTTTFKIGDKVTAGDRRGGVWTDMTYIGRSRFGLDRAKRPDGIVGTFPPGELKLVTPTFDPTKPVQTRDGRKARILCVDRESPVEGKTIVALIRNRAGTEDVARRFADGRYTTRGETAQDLINDPEHKTVYYPLATGGSFRQVPCSNPTAAKALSTISKALAVTCEGIDPVSAEIV